MKGGANEVQGFLISLHVRPGSRARHFKVFGAAAVCDDERRKWHQTITAASSVNRESVTAAIASDEALRNEPVRKDVNTYVCQIWIRMHNQTDGALFSSRDEVNTTASFQTKAYQRRFWFVDG